MDFETLEYQVSELAMAPDTLTVDRQGQAVYVSHTNWHAPGRRPQIGSYQTRLWTGDMERLFASLAHPPFASLPDHWGKVRPGDRYRRVRVSGAAWSAEKLVGTQERVDPALARVLEEFERVIAIVSQHPRQVLVVELTTASVSREGTLSFVLALTGAGTEPVALRSPADLAAGGALPVAVSAWPDKPAASLRPEDVLPLRVLSISRTEPAPADRATAPPGAWLALRPGETAGFRVEAVLPAAPAARVNVRAVYANHSSAIGSRAVLVGELVSNVVVVTAP